MEYVYFKLARVFVFIIIGYLLGKSKIYNKERGKLLQDICFNILLPLIVIPSIWSSELSHANNFLLLTCFFMSGLFIFTSSFFLGHHLFKFRYNECSVYGFSACYGNLVGLGIPLAFSVLGEQEIKQYFYLAGFHGFLHIPYSTLLVEISSRKEENKIKIIFNSVVSLFKNSLFLSLSVGLLLNISNISYPELMEEANELLSLIFVPLMLIIIGASLSTFYLSRYRKELITLIILKNLMHPISGFIIAKYIFSFDNSLIFIITLASSLPSGIQTHYFSARYDVLSDLSSANILFSTFISIFTISIVVYLLG
tara:strand:- start:21065 stop:21997 length:933 start_codon:yes stop_codon:yes gene_type:complete